MFLMFCLRLKKAFLFLQGVEIKLDGDLINDHCVMVFLQNGAV